MSRKADAPLRTKGRAVLMELGPLDYPHFEITRLIYLGLGARTLHLEFHRDPVLRGIHGQKLVPPTDLEGRGGWSLKWVHNYVLAHASAHLDLVSGPTMSLFRGYPAARLNLATDVLEIYPNGFIKSRILSKPEPDQEHRITKFKRKP